jgi:hypothetical protein
MAKDASHFLSYNRNGRLGPICYYIILEPRHRLLSVRQSDMVHGEGSGDNDSAATHPIVSLLASSIITRYILQPGFVARAARLSSFRGTASSASFLLTDHLLKND